MLPVPELLAPAGDLERLEYALRYGADAVYAGLTEFGMRSAPQNFTPEQLAAMESYARDFHRRFPEVRIVGHNELAAKACPSFDAQAWLKEIGINQ